MSQFSELDAEPTSPLDGVLRHHGATMVMRHGRCVAAHFGSAASEAAVCLRTVGIADRSTALRCSCAVSLPMSIGRSRRSALGARTWSARPTSRSAIVRCEHTDASVCSTALSTAQDTLLVELGDRYAVIGVVGPRAGDLLGAAGLDCTEGEPLVLRDGPSSFELLVGIERGPALWDQLLAAGTLFRVACVGLDALAHLAASQRVGRPTSGPVH